MYIPEEAKITKMCLFLSENRNYPIRSRRTLKDAYRFLNGTLIEIFFSDASPMIFSWVLVKVIRFLRLVS